MENLAARVPLSKCFAQRATDLIRLTGTELVAAVVVGTIIGFILDSWFDTKPWLILTFFFLGVTAGIYNVIRVAKSMQVKD